MLSVLFIYLLLAVLSLVLPNAAQLQPPIGFLGAVATVLGTVFGLVPLIQPPPGRITVPPAYRRNFLWDLLSQFIRPRLESQLGRLRRIQIGLQSVPDAVVRPRIVLRRREAMDQDLPHGSQLADVYEEARGALLVLGPPGSGKTTALLELTVALIGDAESDDRLPIPVFLALGSWTSRHPRFEDWLVHMLTLEFGARASYARAWLEAGQILPVLDGLDEVPEDRRDACVDAINRFRREYRLDVVVSSRTQDYESLLQGLELNAAVALEELTEKQVEAYLAAGGESLAELRVALETDDDLRKLSRNPLWLGLMISAYMDPERPPHSEFESIEEHRRWLLYAYVERALDGEHDVPPTYEKGAAAWWLAWLANEMSTRHMPVFLLERLQPDWIPRKGFKVMYGFTTPSLLILLFGYGFWCLSALVLGAMLTWDFGWPMLQSVDTPMSLFRDHMHGLLGSAGTVGLMFVLFAIAVRLIFSGVAARANVHLKPDARRETRAIGDAVCDLSTVFSAAVSGLYRITPVETLTLASLKEFWRSSRGGTPIPVRQRLARYAVCFLFLAGLGGLLWMLDLRRGTESHVLRTLEINPLSLAAELSASADISDRLQAYLMMAEIPASVLTIIAAWLVPQVPVDVETKRRPNEGIRRSGANAIRLGLVGWLLGTLFLLLVVEMPLGAKVVTSVWYGTFVGLCVGIVSGGYAYLQHCALRLALGASYCIPPDLRYERFLEYAVSRRLLRRAGGGYEFVHPLLQQYLADTYRRATT